MDGSNFLQTWSRSWAGLIELWDLNPSVRTGLGKNLLLSDAQKPVSRCIKRSGLPFSSLAYRANNVPTQSRDSRSAGVRNGGTLRELMAQPFLPLIQPNAIVVN